MSERCKHVEKNGFNCGSYAFNLYKDGIDQGNLCDVHYWQAKAQRQPLSVPELEAMWNAQADHMNQWDELGLDEIVAFAQAAHNIKEKNT